MHPVWKVIALTVAAGGCTGFPEVSGPADPEALAAPYPALLPADQIPASASAPAASPSPAPAQTLASDASALRRRADALRGALP
ncbi:MAG: hypothetical protein ACOY4T_12645 [Pseudomonadota bacterium]